MLQPVRMTRARSNSMGVIVDSHLPHLIDLSDDILSTGVLLYHLKEGDTSLGTDDAACQPEIRESLFSLHPGYVIQSWII